MDTTGRAYRLVNSLLRLLDEEIVNLEIIRQRREANFEYLDEAMIKHTLVALQILKRNFLHERDRQDKEEIDIKK
jgi:hypothetical protein